MKCWSGTTGRNFKNVSFAISLILLFLFFIFPRIIEYRQRRDRRMLKSRRSQYPLIEPDDLQQELHGIVRNAIYFITNFMHCRADIAPWISFDRHCMSDVAANKLFTFIWTFITDNCQSIGKAAKCYGRNSSKCHRLVDKKWYWTWFCEIEHSV